MSTLPYQLPLKLGHCFWTSDMVTSKQLPSRIGSSCGELEFFPLPQNCTVHGELQCFALHIWLPQMTPYRPSPPLPKLDLFMENFKMFCTSTSDSATSNHNPPPDSGLLVDNFYIFFHFRFGSSNHAPPPLWNFSWRTLLCGDFGGRVPSH